MLSTQRKFPIYLMILLGWTLSQASRLTRVLPRSGCRRSWPRKFSRWSVFPLSFHFFLICPPRPDTWSQLVWTCLFSVPQITRLVFPPLCLPCESFIALVTQNKISLTSKGMAMRDNIPMSRSLSCPNLTRSSRSKYNYSKCSVSCDCHSLQCSRYNTIE